MESPRVRLIQPVGVTEDPLGALLEGPLRHVVGQPFVQELAVLRRGHGLVLAPLVLLRGLRRVRVSCRKVGLRTRPFFSCVALLRCLPTLDTLVPKNEDQRKGIDLVKHALRQPLMQIATNAGLDASVIVNKVVEAEDANTGFDAANEVMVDMIASGIIDPAKVVRTALTDASGVASLLCTAEVRIGWI